MKKILFILLILLNSNIFAERIYKEFQIDGKTVSKWVDADVTTYKYDTNGNLINEKYSNGDKSWESWYEYDENGNKIHSKWTNASGDNRETWYEYEYNEKGNLIYTKSTHSNGEINETRYKYDEKGRSLGYSSSYNDGNRIWPSWKEKQYNEKGQLFYVWEGSNAHGWEYYYEYDAKGNLIHSYNLDGWDKWYEYDSEGRLIHEKSGYKNNPDDTPYETWYEYDANGNKKIHKKTSHGAEYWEEYDAKGNKIHEKNSYGKDFWYEYDAKGNLIYKKFTSASGDNEEEWYEYEYNENDKIIKKTYYKTI